MNEADMLLDTIQYHSDAVSRPKHCGGEAAAMKTQISKHQIWRGRGYQLW